MTTQFNPYGVGTPTPQANGRVPQFMNLLQNMQQPQENLYPAGEIITVDNEKQLESVNLPVNQRRLYMDRNKPSFYVVATDNVGMKTVKVYDFVEKPIIPPEEYVTKSDFDRLVKTLERVIKNESTIQQQETTEYAGTNEPNTND